MTDTIEKQVRDGLARLRDAAPAEHFDPADDLARGRAARRNARSRVLAGAAASVTAVAVAGGLWVQGGGTPTPSPARSAAATAAVTRSTPLPATSTPLGTPSTTPAALTTDLLGARMAAVVQAHTSGAGRYLGGWGDGSSGSGTRTSMKDSKIARFEITISWGRKGSTSLGGVHVGSASARFLRDEGPTATLDCGGEFTDWPSVCRLVRREPDGSRLHYGSTGTSRAASRTYADGRTAYVSVTAREGGNSLTATTAPLPSKAELLAIVADPRLLWDAPLLDSSSGDPDGRIPWSTPPAGSTGSTR
ncbi:hypothetical protein [Terrabacter sp. C0L_2]|uniref:hypothetical protein n=1 Tax=Terrabacter sp. C0L_2 TaxID=3108389 RepID=UPI002ED396C8|nr:hypothetical protein U5C87_02285 [Terrabacter sp. C0L_2]